MATDFQIFDWRHCLILASVPILIVALSRAARSGEPAARAVRLGLGVFLAVNELVWYGYKLRTEGWRYPEGLPLQLCDLSLWLAVAAAFTRRLPAWEVAYFAGAGGATMAIVTPDLWAPFASYPTAYFFLAHGLLVVTVATLLFGRMVTPRPGAVWRAFAIVNLYAAAIACFNAAYGTNYMYLCHKPTGASLLDLFGPWPWYLLAGEAAALVIFGILALPLRRAAR